MTEQFIVDAEIAVLSIILNNPEKVFEVFDLKSEMLTSSPNQILWGIISQLSEERHLPEINLLISRLKEKNKLERAGGIEYLTFLKAQSFRSENLLEYEKQVINNYKTKMLYSLSSKITGELDSGEQIESIMTRLRGSLDELDSTSNEASVASIETVARDTWEQILYRVDHPGLRGVPTGLADLDSISGGYCEQDLWIIAGRPSMGKSAGMFNSALALGKAGVPVLLCSKEMNKVSCMERFIALESKIPLIDVRSGIYTKNTLDGISDSIKALKSLPIYIDDVCYTIDYVISTIRKYKKLYDVRVVFIDYIQLFATKEENLAQEIGSYSRRLKQLAKELKITIVVLSQLNRKVEMRDEKRPILSDLKESGDLEQDADIVIMYYRDEYYYKEKSKLKGMIEFLIRKFRNGPIGVLTFQFDAPTNIISVDGIV